MSRLTAAINVTMMMKINAYVLAGDPTWIERTVPVYYPHVSRLVVAADINDRGWTGRRVPAQECVERLAAIDSDRKLLVLRGDYVDASDPMAAETRQRQEALDVASQDAEMVLQLDPDELVPDFAQLRQALDSLEPGMGLQWQLFVLYRALRRGRYLLPATPDGTPVREKICIAVPAGTDLVLARNIMNSRLPEGSVKPIVHNSWARDFATMYRKVSTWGHASSAMRRYLLTTWLTSPISWRLMRNLHPLEPRAWPRLCMRSLEELLE